MGGRYNRLVSTTTRRERIGHKEHRDHKERHGHLEKIYENALAHRLRKAGLDAKQQHPIEVLDETSELVRPVILSERLTSVGKG